MIEELFLRIAKSFTTEWYMISTKIQGIIWTLADMVIVIVILKTVRLLCYPGGEKLKLRWFLLGVSIILTPFLVFTQTSREFLRLDVIIVGIQFYILAYTIIFEGKSMLLELKKMVK